MKKYIYIYKATIIENLQYVMNILLGFVSYIILILIFIHLWEYIYADGGNTIGGYTKDQMIWYVIITEMIWFGTRNRILTTQISDDIKSGTIAYGMNKPYNYVMFILARHYGEISVRMFWYIGLALALGFTMIGPLQGFKLRYLPLLIPIFLLATLVSSLIRIIISLMSFWIEDSGPFQWIYDKLIIVIGTLFPIEVFPLWLRPAITYSPIFVVTYGPAKLTINFTVEMFGKVLVSQMAYIVILTIILSIMYRKGVRKLNVNGG